VSERTSRRSQKALRCYDHRGPGWARASLGRDLKDGGVKEGKYQTTVTKEVRAEERQVEKRGKDFLSTS